MKINWGTGIVIAFALFMSFILFFVFLVQSDKKYDNELVISDYYKYEMSLEGQQQKERNANALATRLEVLKSDQGVTITFPNEFDYTKIEGKISLYRPSDEKLDFEIPISLSSSNLLIPRNVLADGRWDIYIDWKYEDTEYFNKKSITQ
ncbi:MAG: FixH family protein [Flavobacteriaceae bacterium]